MDYNRIKFPKNWSAKERKLAKEILDELEMSKDEIVDSTKTGQPVKLVGEAVTLYDYMVGCHAVNDVSESKVLHELFKFNWAKVYPKLIFESNVKIIKIDV